MKLSKRQSDAINDIIQADVQDALHGRSLVVESRRRAERIEEDVDFPPLTEGDADEDGLEELDELDDDDVVLPPMHPRGAGTGSHGGEGLPHVSDDRLGVLPKDPKASTPPPPMHPRGHRS